MKNLKILFFLITFSSVSNGAYLYDQQSRCVDDYYVNNGSIYYLRSGDTRWRSSTADKTAVRMLEGYDFDPITKNCTKVLSDNDVINYTELSSAILVVIILVWSLV